MRTVKEVSQLTGVSIRTLHYYDEIGLLHPTQVTEAGYRLYDDTALSRLQSIMLFRELRFALKDIAAILDSHTFDRDKALSQQIALLELQRERLEQLIDLARHTQKTGGTDMSFQAFDDKKIRDYEKKAKAQWGDTAAWQEFEGKPAAQSAEAAAAVTEGLMQVFQGFGALRGQAPDSDAVRRQVKALQDYITAHFYTCTPEILQGLGQMYAAPGEMHDNIDAAGGQGTADLAAAAIAAFGAR